MLFLTQQLNLQFLRHKPATAYQSFSYKVLNFNLKPDLCCYVKTKMIESTAPSQQPHKRGTIFSGHPAVIS